MTTSSTWSWKDNIFHVIWKQLNPFNTLQKLHHEKSKFSKNNYRGQNPLDCEVLYIIGKLLELQCLKWA
jgi:hypothetical protein